MNREERVRAALADKQIEFTRDLVKRRKAVDLD